MDIRYHGTQIINRLKVEGATPWNPTTLKVLAALRDAIIACPEVAAFEDEETAA